MGFFNRIRSWFKPEPTHHDTAREIVRSWGAPVAGAEAHALHSVNSGYVQEQQPSLAARVKTKLNTAFTQATHKLSDRETWMQVGIGFGSAGLTRLALGAGQATNLPLTLAFASAAGGVSGASVSYYKSYQEYKKRLQDEGREARIVSKDFYREFLSSSDIHREAIKSAGSGAVKGLFGGALFAGLAELWDGIQDLFNPSPASESVVDLHVERHAVVNVPGEDEWLALAEVATDEVPANDVQQGIPNDMEPVEKPSQTAAQYAEPAQAPEEVRLTAVNETSQPITQTTVATTTPITPAFAPDIIKDAPVHNDAGLELVEVQEQQPYYSILDHPEEYLNRPIEDGQDVISLIDGKNYATGEIDPSYLKDPESIEILSEQAPIETPPARPVFNAQSEGHTLPDPVPAAITETDNGPVLLLNMQGSPVNLQPGDTLHFPAAI